MPGPLSSTVRSLSTVATAAAATPRAAASGAPCSCARPGSGSRRRRPGGSVTIPTGQAPGCPAPCSRGSPRGCAPSILRPVPSSSSSTPTSTSAALTNRLRSIELLVAWLDRDVPTIVAGDFNATPDGEPALFTALHDAGLLAALPDDGRGTAHDFQGGTDHRRLDHLYVSRHWEVLTAGVIDADVGRRLPSDHWPVAANLRLR